MLDIRTNKKQKALDFGEIRYCFNLVRGVSDTQYRQLTFKDGGTAVTIEDGVLLIKTSDGTKPDAGKLSVSRVSDGVYKLVTTGASVYRFYRITCSDVAFNVCASRTSIHVEAQMTDGNTSTA